MVGFVPSTDRLQIEAIQVRIGGIDEKSEIKNVPVNFVADCSGPAAVSAKLLPRAGWATNLEKQAYNTPVEYGSAKVTLSDEVVTKLSFAPEKSWDELGWIKAFVPTGGQNCRSFAALKIHPRGGE